MTRLRLSFPFLLLLIVLAMTVTAVAAEDFSPRHFAAVQDGFTQQAAEVAPYATDRLLVKFKAEAMGKSSLSVALTRGTQVPGAESGIASVDVLIRDAGVTSIERPYNRLQNMEKSDELGVDRWFMMYFKATESLGKLAAQLRADDNVEAVSYDWRAFPAVVPNDPIYSEQWGHNNTAQMLSYDWATHNHENGSPVGTVGFDANAESAWGASQGYGDPSVIIAIVDSGVDIDHPDLNLIAGYDFGDNDTNPDDNSAAPGHGTCCAGVAAADANNNLGVAGIAGNCSIMPLKVANSAGSMYFSSIQNAIYHAADNGVDVLSMSLSADISSDAATDAALQYAYEHGVTMLAATSNYNETHIRYPASNQYVIGVGAASPCGDRKRSAASSLYVNPGVNTDPNDYTCDGERWWGSNYGVTTADAAGAVDIIAPTIMPTTDIGGSGGYTSTDYEMWFNGTSCSTPYAAGVCALIISANPGLSPAEVREQLVSTAIDVVNVESGSGWDRYSGYGMVDAEAAVGGGGPVLPVAQFTGSPTSGSFPLNVSFADQSSASPTSWYWDFGDGGNSTAQNPSHSYTVVGSYTVTLTATNAIGSDDEVKPDYISVTEPGVTTFITADGETSVIGTFSGSYLDTRVSDNNNETVSEVIYTGHPRKQYSYMQHEWYFTLPAGDATFHLEAARTANSEGDNFAFEYSSDGSTWLPLATVSSATEQSFSIVVGALSGSITVRVTDTDRSWYATAIDQLHVDYMAFEVGDVEPVAPTAAFSGTPTSGEYPLAVNFADASTGAPTSWSWTFGDGDASTAQNPSHTYTAAGSYTVSLTATNAQGSDTATITDYITVTEPGHGGYSHVQAMLITRVKIGPNYVGNCVVTIYDDGGQPVSGAMVTADYDGPTTGSVSGTTAADGTVTLRSGAYKKPVGEWCFEVTDVAHADLTYDSAANVVTRACESGAVESADGQLVIPNHFGLEQNHPNPFNPMTTISFNLASGGYVTMMVYDVRGHAVASLVSADMPAGSHHVTWDARGHASGIYFYRIETPGFTETRKMIMLK